MAVHALCKGAGTRAREALLLLLLLLRLRTGRSHAARTQSPAILVGRLCCCCSLQVLLPTTSHCTPDSHAHKA
jgi:hypothetical protein